MEYVFRMIDIDRDGEIKAKDLQKVAELVHMESSFGREIKMLTDHCTVTHVRVRVPKENDRIELDKYI